MIWTSDHAAERFIKRGGYDMDIIDAKKFVSNSISEWEVVIRFFKKGTVPIKGTQLRAVVVESENGDLVVATVKYKNTEEFKK